MGPEMGKAAGSPRLGALRSGLWFARSAQLAQPCEHMAMSVVRINAIDVPAERASELESRFAARAGEVDKIDGFEEFQLLRPTDDRTTWLVYTRWRDKSCFEAWVNSAAFHRGHARSEGTEGPVAAHSALWSYELAQHSVVT